MNRKTAALLAASACILGGCTTAAGTSPRPAASAPPPAPFTVGVDLYLNDAITETAATAPAARDLAYIRDVLHVRSVQIDWNLYSSGSSVHPGPSTPPPAVIGDITRMARARFGMSVSYRVLFSVPAPPGRTGRIAPRDREAWFASLHATEKPYLETAQKDHVVEFIAGTERTTIERAPGWAGFYRQAARIYDGTLSYATWGGRPGYGGVTDGDLSEFPPVHDYGITAYPDAPLPPSAPQPAVTADWAAFLLRIPESVLRRTALDEIGIAAAPGAYRDPWNFTAYSGPAAARVQARWYTAACTTARELHMRGVWFFPMFLDDNPYDPYPSLAKFEDRPASVAAIRACAEGGR